MTYNEKKSLYESIMTEIAKKVKRSLNEAYSSSVVKEFTKLTMDPKNPMQEFIMCFANYYPQMNEFRIFPFYGKKDMTNMEEGRKEFLKNVFNFKQMNNLVLSELTDDDLYDGKIYKKANFVKSFGQSEDAIFCLVIGRLSERYPEDVIASYVLPLKKESAEEKANAMRKKRMDRIENRIPSQHSDDLKRELDFIKREQEEMFKGSSIKDDEELKSLIGKEINTFCRNINKILGQKQLIKSRNQRTDLFKKIYNTMGWYISQYLR